jgi:hypothetical protein
VRFASAAGRSAVSGIAVAVLATATVGIAAAAPQRHDGVHRRHDGVHRHSTGSAPHRHVAPLTAARRHLAHTAIVGGSQISIEQAPWQVFIEARTAPTEGKACSGSILDAAHVLTAAHCVFDSTTRVKIPTEDITVVAGTADLNIHEPGEQTSKVASVRVHPYYVYDPGSGVSTPDDVAVLELAEPFILQSGPEATARAIPLVPDGSIAAEGTQANLTGFGQQNPNTELNGLLYSIPMTLGSSRTCGREADAVFVCASDPTGALCSGDSGSGLTTGLSPSLLAVVNTGQVIGGVSCSLGSRGGFANLAAPEIQDFVAGSETPPRAPRGGGPTLTGTPTVGDSLSCQPGSWSGEPTFIYTFLDSMGGPPLQSSPSSSYQLPAADVGLSILCEVQATNAGGVGTDETVALSPVGVASVPPPLVHGPASTPKATLIGSTLAIKSGHEALVRLDCEGGPKCTGKLTLLVTRTLRKGRKKLVRTLTVGSVRFSLQGGLKTTVKLDLNATGRALLSTAHGRLSARLQITELIPGEPSLSKTDNVRLLAQGKSSSAPAKGRR